MSNTKMVVRHLNLVLLGGIKSIKGLYSESEVNYSIVPNAWHADYKNHVFVLCE